METGDGDPILIAGYDVVPRCGHGESGGEAAAEEQRHGRGCGGGLAGRTDWA